MYSSTTSCVRQQTSLFVGEVVKEDSEDHPTFVLNLQNVSLSPSIPSLQDYYLPKNQAGTYPTSDGFPDVFLKTKSTYQIFTFLSQTITSLLFSFHRSIVRLILRIIHFIANSIYMQHNVIQTTKNSTINAQCTSISKSQ